jgi:hypothetical protein
MQTSYRTPQRYRVGKAALLGQSASKTRVNALMLPTSGRAANTDRGVSVRVGTALDIGAQLQEPSGAFAHPTLIQSHPNMR